jgi:hypothetical protein
MRITTSSRGRFPSASAAPCERENRNLAAPAFRVSGGRMPLRRELFGAARCCRLRARGRNSVGRMPASQAGRRRFESGRPLLVINTYSAVGIFDSGGVVVGTRAGDRSVVSRRCSRDRQRALFTQPWDRPEPCGTRRRRVYHTCTKRHVTVRTSLARLRAASGAPGRRADGDATAARPISPAWETAA